MGMIVAWIKVGNLCWGKLAPMLADMTNPRNHKRRMDTLTWMVASVRIFAMNFPLMHLAFFKQFTDPRCGGNGDNFLDVVYQAYDGEWPKGIPTSNGMLADNASLTWIEHWHHVKNGTHCLDGCFPEECTLQYDGDYACVTN